jgi:hypothetical protein
MVFSTTACNKKSTVSDAQIANGLDAEGEYPEVVKLKLNNGQGMCTGTFVSSNTLITAAHCVKSGVVEYNGVKAIDLIYDHTYTELHDKDFAVVIFPEGTAPATAQIITKAPKEGDEFVIVGYGNNDNIRETGAGKKRKGSNKISSITNDMIIFYGSAATQGTATGENATSGKGDSGGPLFIDGQLAAVTCCGMVAQDVEGKPFSISMYVNVQGQYSQQQVKEALSRGAKIPGEGTISPPTAGVQPTLERTPSPTITTARTPGLPGTTTTPIRTPTLVPTTPLNNAPERTVANLDCNKDYSKIRQGGSGICVNATSGFKRCYKYSNKDVQYNSGTVSCVSLSSPVAEAPKDGKLLDCNKDYSTIRKGGSGVCLNATSGFRHCYKYSNKDVQYTQSVKCP